MSIIINNNQIHLKSKNTSYIFCIYQNKYLCHLYWGRGLNNDVDLSYEPDIQIFSRPSSFSPPVDESCANDKRIFLEDLNLEFAILGNGDYRSPSFEAIYENGSSVSEFEYIEHQIINGKPKLSGLPATYTDDDTEAQTIEIILRDNLTGLKVILIYSVFEEYDVITRSIRYENDGNSIIKLNKLMSASVDFSGMDFNLLHLHGAWTREREIEYVPVKHGIHIIDSKRGFSGHSENPFVALLDSDSTEYYGNVFGFSLVYSGNFYASCEVSTYDATRLMIGINPFNFEWNLKPSQSFQSPEAVLVFSDKGLDGMSQIYHRIYRERLCREPHKNAIRPIVINNWEGTYFDFDEQKLLNIARVAKDIGIEMFVLDDGWFGNRNDDKSSLGDWFVNQAKLPNGLQPLVQKINAMGMKFGLWLEPEMVSPDSDLYRKHPDWCLHVDGRKRTTARNQLVLDLSRGDVRKYIIGFISDLLIDSNIEYIKWDCNRNFTEIGSAMLSAEYQQEISHRYMLGLYEVMEKITGAFPNVLFEGCSGGGGRFDPGMLYYMPQTWTSDNTDPVDRLFIQYGTSIVYPPITMGAHVAANPSGIAGRTVSLSTRCAVAMSGNFGFELDLSELNATEIEETKKQIDFYKEIRSLIQFGRFHRLENPFEGRFASWEFISDDKTEIMVFLFQMMMKYNFSARRIKLKCLVTDKLYKCSDGRVYLGDVLMNVGIQIPFKQNDYTSQILHFKSIK